MLKIFRKHKRTIFISSCFFIFILYLIFPLNFDTKIYLEAAQRADMVGGFPTNVIQAWEHKYLLNRLLFYFLYKIAKLIFPLNNIILFECVIKIIYGLLCYAIIKWFSKSTKSFFEKYHISEPTVFFILYIVIFASDIYFSLQTEMTALLLTLISIIFVLKDTPYHKLLAAFTISTLFWLKGVTLLYSVIVLVVMLLANHKKSDIVFTICCSFGFLILELFCVFCFVPTEATNMYLATKYLSGNTLKIDIRMFLIEALYMYKFSFVSLIMFFINITNHVKTKSFKLLIGEISCWMLLLIGVYIQHMRYHYQIGLMIPAILLSTFIFIYYKDKKFINIKKLTPLILFLNVMLIANIVSESILAIEIHKVTLHNAKQASILEKEIPDLKNDEILYIGNGLTSYYINAPSYTNYTTTIFLANHNNFYLQSEHINNLKEYIQEYNGKYIIIDQTELFDKFRISDDIWEFIEKNYHYKQSTGINIYETESNEYSIIFEKNT